MPSTQSWTEYNGANAATATASRTEANWKNVDDSTTAYSSSQVTYGNNSFDKNQALVFAGTWNSISSLTYKVSSNTPATGLSVVGSVRVNGTTPSTTATGDAAASTTGTAANLAGTASPYGTTLSAALSTAAAITSLPVAALPNAVASGASIVVTSGANTQTFTASAAAAAAATSITVTSATPTFAFPIGSIVQTAQTSASGGGTYYAQAYRTQLQTTTAAAAGDIPSVTITGTWTES